MHPTNVLILHALVQIREGEGAMIENWEVHVEMSTSSLVKLQPGTTVTSVF